MTEKWVTDQVTGLQRMGRKGAYTYRKWGSHHVDLDGLNADEVFNRLHETEEKWFPWGATLSVYAETSESWGDTYTELISELVGYMLVPTEEAEREIAAAIAKADAQDKANLESARTQAKRLLERYPELKDLL